MSPGVPRYVSEIVKERLPVEASNEGKMESAMNDKNLKRTSKFLSLVLRHQPEKIGISLDEAGWTDVDALLRAMSRRGKRISRETLDYVVRTNDKKRFSFSDDGRQIRANQGHSIDVDLGYASAVPPDVLYHGTATRNLEPILAQGLVKGRRHHVHLSTDQATMLAVGKRHGEPVLLAVNAAQMHAEGHAFFVTGNEVWLTDHVPPRFLTVIA